MRFLIGIILFLLPSFSHAEFIINKSGLIINGLIDDDLANDIENYFKIHKREGQNFELNSQGGSVYAAIKIGRLMRNNNASIIVNKKCLSSCFLIYISGVSRFIGIDFDATGNNILEPISGQVGFHRPYYDIKNPKKNITKNEYDVMLNDLKVYFNEMNISITVYDLMINTPPDSMKIYVGNSKFGNYIESIVPNSDPFFEESQIVLKSIFRGISTLEIRKKEKEIKNKCINYITNNYLYNACQSSIWYDISFDLALKRQSIVDAECDYKKIFTETEYNSFKSQTETDRVINKFYNKYISCESSIFKSDLYLSPIK